MATKASFQPSNLPCVSQFQGSMSFCVWNVNQRGNIIRDFVVNKGEFQNGRYKARQIFRKANISYPLIHILPWPALFSCNSRFEILPFALLPTTLDRDYNLEDSLSLLLFLINKICEGVLEMQTKLHECFSIILPNPHIITGLFLFPLKTVENLFWCFQGVQKETSYMTWLRTHKNRTLCGMLQNGKCFY